MAAIFGGTKFFFENWVTDILWVKNFIKITLSSTVFVIQGLQNGFKKVFTYQYCSICVPYEPIFPILCFAFFVKNSKIEYEPHFW